MWRWLAEIWDFINIYGGNKLLTKRLLCRLSYGGIELCGEHYKGLKLERQGLL